MGRSSRRIPIQRPIIPTVDLGMLERQIEGLYYPDDVPLALAIQVILTPSGPRIAQGAVSGAQATTRPGPSQSNIVPSRTDTATFNSADMAAPPFTTALFFFRITAISGTGASVTFAVQTRETSGLYSITAGGGATTALTTATAASVGVGVGQSGQAGLLGPLFRIDATISGTTPSITWTCDMVWA